MPPIFHSLTLGENERPTRKDKFFRRCCTRDKMDEEAALPPEAYRLFSCQCRLREFAETCCRSQPPAFRGGVLDVDAVCVQHVHSQLHLCQLQSGSLHYYHSMVQAIATLPTSELVFVRNARNKLSYTK